MLQTTKMMKVVAVPQFLMMLLFPSLSLTAADATDCPADGCDCSKNYQGMIIVECLNMMEFPNFATFTNAVSYVIVEGNYTTIPANAFYSLQSINYGVVLKRKPENSKVPINIDKAAFQFYQRRAISLSFFSFAAMNSPPSAFQNVTLSELLFDSCTGFIFLTNGGPLNGLSVFILRFVNCGIVSATTDLLTDIIFQPTGLTLDFSYNPFSVIPSAVQTTGVTSVDLSNNGLAAIVDYAFVCSPNTACNVNGTLREINLNSNCIVSDEEFGADAFSNLPYLSFLSLQNLSLSTVLPDVLKPVASTLTYLDFQFNKISSIPANAFNGFLSLSSLNFFGNPITDIAVGAFNGTDKMTTLILENIGTLLSVDLLITTGMKNVGSLSLAYGGNLANINLSDVSMMPSNLMKVDVSHNNLETIQSTVGDWLNQTAHAVLDISYNNNITCTEDISWMAPFVLSKQILTVSTNCSNGQSLDDFLAPLSSI